jgi:hypothetical protein
MAAIIINVMAIGKSTKNDNHNGDVTHTHDQSIYPVSFNTKNIKNKTPKKPIPDEELLLLI